MNQSANRMAGRKTGLDLIKVIAMLMITATHYIGYSGLLENTEILPVNHILFTWIMILSRAAINLFAIVSGYLLSRKSFSVDRIIRIWFDVVFISLVGLAAAIAFGNVPNKGVLLKSILPVTTFSYWYIDTYVMLLCIAPFLNMLISKWNTQILFRVCCALTGVCCVFLTMNPFANAQLYIGHGHGIVWFSVLYLWGGCFAREDFAVSKHRAAVFGLLAQLILVVLSLIGDRVPFLSQFSLFEMNSLFMVTIALSMFVLLKDISVKGKLRTFLNSMAEASLFVYLIQEHNALRTGFWSLFGMADLAGSYYIWLDFLLAMICLWPFAYLTKKAAGWIWPMFHGLIMPLKRRFQLMQ